MTKTKENKQFIVPVHNLNKVNHVFKELSYFNMHQTLLNSNNNNYFENSNTSPVQ